MASYSKAYCLSQHCYGKALVLVPDIASRRRSVPRLSARRPLGFVLVSPKATRFRYFPPEGGSGMVPSKKLRGLRGYGIVPPKAVLVLYP